jgi:hypothetical protein
VVCGVLSQGQLLVVGWTRQADLKAKTSEGFLGIIVSENDFFDFCIFRSPPPLIFFRFWLVVVPSQRSAVVRGSWL